MTNITDPALRCYELDNTVANRTGTVSVPAGSKIGFTASGGITHTGYLSIYMSPAAPAANSQSAGNGATWFKIWDWGPTYASSGYSGSALLWPSQGVCRRAVMHTDLLKCEYEGVQNITFPIPRSLPSG